MAFATTASRAAETFGLSLDGDTGSTDSTWCITASAAFALNGCSPVKSW